MKKQKLLSLILILPLFLAGCSIGISNKSTAPSELTGGFFRSADLGNTWDKMNTLYTLGDKTATFDASSVTVMTYDPLDDSAIYLGTLHDGIFYSYDYGDGWTRTLSGLGTVNDIVVDGERNCTIFAAVHNAIFKTKDCSRTWDKIYFEPGKGQYINSLAISSHDNDIIFAGTLSGSLLRSEDQGINWDVTERFGDMVKNIFVVEDENSRVVYAVTQKRGIFRSPDDGLSWENLLDWRVDRAEIDEDVLFDEFLVAREEAKLAATCQKLNSTEKKSITEGVDDVDRRTELLAAAEEEKFKQTCKYLTKEEKIEYEKRNKYLPLGKIKGSSVVITASLDRSLDDAVIYANNGAIYRITKDKYGPMWKQIKLLTPPNKGEAIFSVLVNPKNTAELFYGTSAAFYHSIDDGGSWNISNLPTDHSARSLSFSLDNRFLYLGAYQIIKK
ncbi:MAG: hypothetical protein WCS88_03325 [Patescibacteria group bacterium]